MLANQNQNPNVEFFFENLAIKKKENIAIKKNAIWKNFAPKKIVLLRP